MAARAESRDGRTGARTVIETSARLRGELRSRHAGFLRSARPGRSQRNLRRGRVLSSQSSASVSSPLLGANRSAGAPAAKRQRRHSAGAWPHGPSRGTGAEGARAVIRAYPRLRGRSVAARAKPPSCLRQGRGVAPQARRLLAFRKAGKVSAKLVAWTRFHLSIRRGASRRSRARIARGATPADVRRRPAQARASARRSKARIVQSGHGRLEMGKCTTTAQTRINTGVFIVVQVYKNRRKRTRMGYTCTPRQQRKAA